MNQQLSSRNYRTRMYSEQNKTKKVLIVEDEQILGDIMLHKLVSEGYDAVLAVDGAQGIAKMRDWMPDLVLLDLVMPNKNGQEVLEEMRGEKVLKNIPVVIISNSGLQSELEKVVELGVKDYLIKAQFSPDDLVEKVKKYFNQEFVESRQPGSEAIPLKNIKILLAEDDAFISSLVAQKLNKDGYKVLSATTGKQALSVLEESNPDLVMLDIVMPDTNGLEVLKTIRSQEKYKDTIVVIFSNNGQEHEIEEAKKLGVDAFLVKVDFTLKEVAVKLRELLVAKGKI